MLIDSGSFARSAWGCADLATQGTLVAEKLLAFTTPGQPPLNPVLRSHPLKDHAFFFVDCVS
jgi:hypothetical protein